MFGQLALSLRWLLSQSATDVACMHCLHACTRHLTVHACTVRWCTVPRVYVVYYTQVLPILDGFKFECMNPSVLICRHMSLYVAICLYMSAYVTFVFDLYLSPMHHTCVTPGETI